MSDPRPRTRTRPRLFLLTAALLPLLAPLAACDEDHAPGDGTNNPSNAFAASGLAVLSSNFVSTSVSLYDPKTGALHDDCVHTGGAGADLSGDVTLPSQAQMGGELVVIDRGNAELAFVRPADCQVRTQLSVGTGFKANPRDVVRLGPTKAYVTRYETNGTPGQFPFDGGNDILIIDPSAPSVTGRVDLSGYATSVPGATISARPDRAVLAQGKVYVSLGNLSDMFVAGPGRIVIVDPASDQVTGMIDLAGQTECSGLDYVSATKRLYVACGEPFGGGVPTSALVEIDLSGATPAIARTIAAANLGPGTQPVNFAYVAATGTLAFVGLVGERDLQNATTISDGFYVIPGGSAPAAMKLFDGGGFSIGRPAVSDAGDKLLVPDGDDVRPHVHVMAIAAGGAVTPAADLDANPAGGLPPREVARY